RPSDKFQAEVASWRLPAAHPISRRILFHGEDTPRRCCMNRWKMLAAVFAFVPMIGALRAQETPRTPDDTKPGDQRMPTFQPGKEHQLLKQFDGDWEFKSKCTMPGQEPQEGQGTETSKLTYGGFWLECEDKGIMKGKDFSGEGL